jgi:hypothetical protein
MRTILIIFIFSGCITFGLQAEEPIRIISEQGGVLMQEKTTPVKKKTPVNPNQAKINKIITDFKAGKIAYPEAESKLQPLLKDDLQASVQEMDSRISSLEGELKQLKKLKTDKDYLSKMRINRLLSGRM